MTPKEIPDGKFDGGRYYTANSTLVAVHLSTSGQGTMYHGHRLSVGKALVADAMDYIEWGRQGNCTYVKYDSGQIEEKNLSWYNLVNIVRGVDFVASVAVKGCEDCKKSLWEAA